MPLEPVARKTLSDQVYDQLSQEIVAGRMEPGQTLPPERELVELLAVNRGAVREALKRLAQAGLISIHQGGGSKVLNFRRTASLDLLGQLLFHGDGTVDLEVARSLMEMRRAIAPDIAALCARRAGSSIADELEAVVSAMEGPHAKLDEHDDLDELQSLALRFWDLLVQGADNIAYELAFNTLRHTYERIRVALVHVLESELRDTKSYRSIADAIARGDDVSARHVAAALMDHGTHGVFEVIAALENGDTKRRKK